MEFINNKIIYIILILFSLIEVVSTTKENKIFLLSLYGIVFFINYTFNKYNNLLFLRKLKAINNDFKELKGQSEEFFSKAVKSEGTLIDLEDNYYNYIEKIIKFSKVSRRERLKTELYSSSIIKTVALKLDKPVTILWENANKIEENSKSSSKVLDKLSNNIMFIKKIVDNLFESSKINSSSIELNNKKTDINLFLREIIVNYEEELLKNNLILEKNIEDRNIFLTIDSDKLLRIFEILIENIITHGMEGTRVYIEAMIIEKKYRIVMKNISREKLNISMDKLYENINEKVYRTGLELEIVKGLVKLINGDVKFFIDGDLFKAIIDFDLGEESYDI